MIDELLPRYYEDHGPGLTYEPIRSIVVDGHEVWWAQYSGRVKAGAAEGREFTGRSVVCECDFTPGVGYEVKRWRGPSGDQEERNQIYSLDGEKRCLARKTALHLRHLELRAEYREKFKSADAWDSEFTLRRNVGPIILDLMERAQAGEFLGEDGGGATFWGGYFYLQTVASITDQFIGHLWGEVDRLVRERQIGLEGAVIQPYREPPPDSWEEFARLELDGWTGIASLPGNRKMAREWKLEVLDPEGKPAYGYVPGLGLLHDPVFGPDVEDVAIARARLEELITKAAQQKTKEAEDATTGG